MMGLLKHVVAVVAADIGDDFILKVGQFGQEAVPFSIAAPFGVNFNAENVKRSFAPGHKIPHDPKNLPPVIIADFFGSADANDISGKIAG